MRKVPQYQALIKERFERCLDLYLCPREAKTKLDIDPDSLIPQLPSPAELRPFPERYLFLYIYISIYLCRCIYTFPLYTFSCTSDARSDPHSGSRTIHVDLSIYLCSSR